MQTTVASSTECRSIEDNVSDTANGLNDADWLGRRVLSSQAIDRRDLQARIDCSSGGAIKIRPRQALQLPLQRFAPGWLLGFVDGFPASHECRNGYAVGHLLGLSTRERAVAAMNSSTRY